MLHGIGHPRDGRRWSHSARCRMCGNGFVPLEHRRATCSRASVRYTNALATLSYRLRSPLQHALDRGISVVKKGYAPAVSIVPM